MQTSAKPAQRVGLLQGEEMFGPPVTVQTFGDDLAAGLEAMVFQGRQLLGIAFAGEEGRQDGLAGDAGQVADDVVELEVHLGEGLVQMAHAAAGPAHQGIAMPQDRAHGGIVPAAIGGRVGRPLLPLLRLDSFEVTEYVGLHGVCSFGHYGCLGRESHNLWLGVPIHLGPQPTLTPESRHHFRFHQKPY